MSNELRVSDDEIEGRVYQQLSTQHPLHAAFSEAWRRLGGMDHLVKFGEERPDKFYALMTRMMPGLVPTHGMQGDVTINVHADLGPSALDGEYEEVEDVDDAV